MCVCIYNVLLLKKRVEMSEIRMCVVFCLQMKKKSDFLFGAKGREKREREISSVLILSLVAF